jgi:hypothetical protein
MRPCTARRPQATAGHSEPPPLRRAPTSPSYRVAAFHRLPPPSAPCRASLKGCYPIAAMPPPLISLLRRTHEHHNPPPPSSLCPRRVIGPSPPSPYSCRRAASSAPPPIHGENGHCSLFLQVKPPLTSLSLTQRCRSTPSRRRPPWELPAVGVPPPIHYRAASPSTTLSR